MKEILFLEMHECTVKMARIRIVKSFLSFLLKNLSCSTVPGKEVFSKNIDNKVKIFTFTNKSYFLQTSGGKERYLMIKYY
jgi:hypothetical protein